jgi:hypothetical protein
MKPQDIVILLKLLCIQKEQQLGRGFDRSTASGPYAMRSLEASLGISKSEISASLKRSIAPELATKIGDQIKVNRRNLSEFILHGLKYSFPITPGAPQRGVPTGFAAPMLEGSILSGSEDIHVWPHAQGPIRGLAVEPLYKSVPEAALKDEQLYEYLALIDALRLGRAREANLAAEKLKQKISDA